MTARLNVGLVVIRADRRWCEENAADATPADHLNAIIRAVDEHVGTAAVDQLSADLANTKALLGKLVQAVTGEWKSGGCHAKQVNDAVRQVRAVREYLTNEAQRGAA